MSEDRFTNRYRIPSTRAPWHYYDGGIYFVTICTAQREHFFGEIQNERMLFSPIGQYANDQFTNITIHYPYAEIPSFVVMPNHIHAIVLINGDKWELQQMTKLGNDCRDGVHTVSTEKRWKSQVVDKTMQFISHQKGPLSVIIGGLKRCVTIYAHEHAIPFQWQTRFYDHIVRNQNELNRITLYIEQNVAKWNEDELY